MPIRKFNYRIKLLIAVSLFFNVLSAFWGIKHYIYLKKSDGNPIFFLRRGTPTYSINRQSVFDLFPITKNDIVFIGDSHTQRYDVEEFLKGYPVVNRGIDFDISSGVLNRIDRIISGHPKKIFIEVGFNDIWRGIPSDTTVGNISLITAKIKHQSPSTKIYILSILPSGSRVHGVYVKDSVVILNDKIKTYCKQGDIPYIDVNSKLSDNNSLNYLYDGGDGIHLNGQGYVIFTKTIKPYLNN